MGVDIQFDPFLVMKNLFKQKLELYTKLRYGNKTIEVVHLSNVYMIKSTKKMLNKEGKRLCITDSFFALATLYPKHIGLACPGCGIWFLSKTYSVSWVWSFAYSIGLVGKMANLVL